VLPRHGSHCARGNSSPGYPAIPACPTATTTQGLIQSVYELSDSSGLIITVGKYLTPRGVDIDRFGIAPDFKSLPSQREAETALNACRLEAAAGAGGGAAA
jgi:C-terminal processing protease CtpA/Prc